jgi:hypothetical protein
MQTIDMDFWKIIKEKTIIVNNVFKERGIQNLLAPS